MASRVHVVLTFLSGLIAGTSATAVDQPRDHHVDHDHLAEPGSSAPPSDPAVDAGASGAAGTTTPGLTWAVSMTDEVTMSGQLDAVVIRPSPPDDPA
jgi:hypothetical protein